MHDGTPIVNIKCIEDKAHRLSRFLTAHAPEANIHRSGTALEEIK
jgi:hypothetical protein